MPDLDLSIQIEDAFVGSVLESWLRHVAGHALSTAGVRSPVELSLVVAGDDTVRTLNRTHRGVDDTTDVLAFALSEPDSGPAERFVMPPDGTLHLGEIIISYPQARAQAETMQHSTEQEMALLIAHGVLHLLGYDHESPEDEQRMRAMESEILDSLDRR